MSDCFGEVRERDQDVPSVRFNRGAQSRATTQLLPVAAPQPDAPVRMARPGPKLVPTAEHPAVTGRGFEERRRELRDRLEEQLDDARNIDVEIIDDCAVLRGSVSCSLAKLLAEDLAYSMPEISDCYNILEVTGTSDIIAA